MTRPFPEALKGKEAVMALHIGHLPHTNLLPTQRVNELTSDTMTRLHVTGFFILGFVAAVVLLTLL